MFIFIKTTHSPAAKPGQSLSIQKEAGYFTVRHAEHGVWAILKQFPTYPRTYCIKDSCGNAILGYGPRYPDLDDEFLRIQLSPDGTVRVERDTLCTLPLFYSFTEDMFIITNDYSELVAQLPKLTLDKEGMINCLSGANTTFLKLWKEVNYLGEREVLVVQNGQLVITPQNPRKWRSNQELIPSEPRDFPAMLEQAFTEVQKRFDGPAIGFEISGGLDSSLLPLFLASQGHYQGRMLGGSKIQPMPQERHQRFKLSAIERHASTHIYKTKLLVDRDHPFSSLIHEKVCQPFYIGTGLYEASTIRLAKYFRSQRVSVVATGGGGDELCENWPLRLVHAKSDRPAFWTKRLTPIHHPVMQGELSHNVVLAALGHSNSYINLDIWPISPFYNIKLFSFCQALPVQFRANKNIMRLYAAAMGFPPSIYEGPNEDFGNFFNHCLVSPAYQRLIEFYARHSYTQQLGLIDTTALKKIYARLLANPLDSSSFFYLYLWLCVEINLHAAAKTGQWELSRGS